MTKFLMKLEDVKQEFVLNGYTPLFNKYINLDAKLLTVNKDGYKVYTTLRKIRKGENSSAFHKSNPFTLDNIRVWLKSNLDYELVSEVYIDSRSLLELHCNKHGNFLKSWDNIKQGQGCPICANEVKVNSFKLSYEYIKKKFSDKGYRLISNDYKNAQQKLKYICNKHENKGFQFIKYGHLQQGHGCKYCGVEDITGSYSLKAAERNKSEWLKLKATVYFIKCFNEYEQFYKIGVTQSTVKSRFVNGGMPYNYIEVYRITSNLYNAIYLENSLHKLHKEYSYIPKLYFGGFTECFSQLNIKNIKSILK